MVKASRSTLITLSGLIWLVIGGLLFTKGAKWISSLDQNEWTPLYDFLALFYPYPNQYSACILAGCLLTGYLKSKWIFARTARKAIERISSLPNPVSILKIYPLKYYALIATMISLGYFVRQSNLPTDLRAAMYLSIGFALMRSSLYFLRKGPLNDTIDHSGDAIDSKTYCRGPDNPKKDRLKLSQ